MVPYHIMKMRIVFETGMQDLPEGKTVENQHVLDRTRIQEVQAKSLIS